MYRPYVAKSDPDPVKKKRSGSATLVSPISPKYWDYIEKKEIKLPFLLINVFVQFSILSKHGSSWCLLHETC